MLTSLHLHKKSSEVSIKTRSTPASLSIQGQDTKHTTVKWSIAFPQLPDECWRRAPKINESLIRCFVNWMLSRATHAPSKSNK